MDSRFREVIRLLEAIPRDFYGEVKIRIRGGRPVMLAEERTVKLDGKPSSDERKSKGE